MIGVKKCPLCNSGKKSEGFIIEEFPYFTSPVKKDDKEKILKKYEIDELFSRLETAICEDCSHVYLSSLPNQKIISELYKKYYSYPSALEGSFHPERDNLFLKIFNKEIGKSIKPSQKQVLEIGCYDGYILYNLKKLGFCVTGCDPSKGASIGKRFGVNIKRRFFNAEDFLKKGLKYDIIIFRHFLEHISFPVSFLKIVKKILKTAGVIIFEVPNVKFFLKNSNTAVFSFQHLQYFSSISLYRLLEEAGLRPINFIESGENLIVICSEGIPVEHRNKGTIPELFSSFRNNLESQNVLLQKMIKRYLDKGIVLWGAGGFSSNALEIYKIPSDNIRLIIDSDTKKWDMEFLKYHIPIKSPKYLKKYSHDCLVICSMYAKEIVSKLIDLKYERPIVNLHPKLRLFRGDRR